MKKQIHITLDPMAKDLFADFFSKDNEGQQVYVFRDYLNEGQLRSDIGVNFDQVRAEYYYTFYQLSDKQLSDVPTTEKDMLQISTRISNGEEYELVVWMGNNELDVIGYYFLLHYFKRYAHNISIINIAGLPFIDKNGKLFFPKRVSELDSHCLAKALQLKRPLTPTEIEIDIDEWKTLKDENALIRVLAGNKRIRSVTSEAFDEIMRQHFNSSFRTLKNVAVINEKMNSTLSEQFILKKAFTLGLSKKDKSKEEDPNQTSLGL